MGVTAKVRLRIRDIDSGLAISLGNVTLGIGEFDADADVEFKDLRSFHQALGNAIALHDTDRMARLQRDFDALQDKVLNAHTDDRVEKLQKAFETIQGQIVNASHTHDASNTLNAGGR